MSDSQAFGPTNKSGTCLWCGRPLRPMRLGTAKALAREIRKIESSHYSEAYKAREIEEAKKSHQRNRGKLGSYGDDFFCGLNCGYEFGLAAARFGTRLKEKK